MVGCTSFNSSVMSGDTTAVKEALARGQDPNAWEPSDLQPPLCTAIANEHTDIALLLIEAKANPDVTCQWKHHSTYTPLEIAMRKGNYRVIEALIARGADPSLSPTYDKSFLFGFINERDMLDDGVDRSKVVRNYLRRVAEKHGAQKAIDLACHTSG